jgi:hypothetical protein
LRRVAAGILGAALGVAATGCGPSASADSGITALLRVPGAQFVEGALEPDTSATGSAVISGVALINTTIYPGEQSFPLSGTVTGATALVGLKGDAGYWIVPAPIPDLTTVGGYDFTTSLTFSPLLATGKQTLILRGVAPDGTVGPAQIFILQSQTLAPTGFPLVITLEWDTESDMDLHVVIPNTIDDSGPIEIWNKHEVGVPPPALGTFLDPSVVAGAPYLDFDSNANCVIDGRRQENVIVPMGATVPPGDYTVRVDAFSLCGQSGAQWTATATQYDAYGNATVINSAQWQATADDTRGTHGAGSGRLAFNFTITPVTP